MTIIRVIGDVAVLIALALFLSMIATWSALICGA